MSLKEYTAEEVAVHNTKESLWVILHGKVLDVTKFAPDHPGGIFVILEDAGKDISTNFDEVNHSDDAKKHADSFAIGVLKGSPAAAAAAATASAPAVLSFLENISIFNNHY